MIKEFVDRFVEKKPELEAVFATKHPDSYDEVIKAVASILKNDADYGTIDPERIHRINDGNQGTLVFVIGASDTSRATIGTLRSVMDLVPGATRCKGSATIRAMRPHRNR